MKLGFLTVSLGKLPLKEKALWASKNGFKAVEIACWPFENDRDYSSSDIDAGKLTRKEADGIKSYMLEYGLEISALAYYDNNLDADRKKREFVNSHLKKCIDAAAMLGTDKVGTFIGRNIEKSIEENFDEFEALFTGIVSYAAKSNIKIMIENCPMEGWRKPGVPGTISFNPELWEEMFRRIPDKNFGLNYDPSHLLFQLIDYIEPLKEFSERIFHVHAKDSEIFRDKLKWYGVFNRSIGTASGNGYWRYRMPGLGQVDWDGLIKGLRSAGYDSVISIEHEDHLYEGSEKKIKEGLVLGRQHLEKFF